MTTTQCNTKNKGLSAALQQITAPDTVNLKNRKPLFTSFPSNTLYQCTLPMPEAFIVMLMEPGAIALGGSVNKW